MICEENSKLKETKIFSKSHEGRWILVLNLGLEQTLF